jgi:AcrR family transcriptional regulator
MTQVEASGRRERKKAVTRARIIEEATTLFRARGYQATTIEDITEAADVAPRTFYSYFDAKVDVALAQFEEWAEHHYEAMAARPAGETPVEMAEGALAELARLGYVTSERLQDEDGAPYPPIAAAVVLSETEPEVAGRMYQVLIGFQARMTELFRERLGYPVGAIEPRILAASMSATWFVAIYGFGDICAGELDPPSLDELGLTGMRAYSRGMDRLWEGRLGGTPQ